MICRMWRGWTAPENAAAYQRLLTGTILPDIRARNIPGLITHQALRRDTVGEDGVPEVEHTVLIWFETLEHIKGFVGEDYTIAYVPTTAQAVLARWDPRATHWDVFDNPCAP